MNVLVFGATSTIAEHVARRFAADQAHLYLLARDTGRLRAVRTDLLARGAASVETACFDAANLGALEQTAEAAWSSMGTVDVALVCHGTLTDQGRAESELAYSAEEFTVNATSVTALATWLGARFAAQKRGTLAVLGSVAGDRGRPSNYLYGAAKSAVAVCASGLQSKLSAEGVTVLTVKPGFVRTAMTADAELPELLTASPDRVAGDIYKAIEKNRAGVMYSPWFWRWIMLAIRLIPQPVFNRLPL